MEKFEITGIMPKKTCKDKTTTFLPNTAHPQHLLLFFHPKKKKIAGSTTDWSYKGATTKQSQMH